VVGLALWPDHPPLGARASTRSLGHPTSFRGIRLNQVCTVASASARGCGRLRRAAADARCGRRPGATSGSAVSPVSRVAAVVAGEV